MAVSSWSGEVIVMGDFNEVKFDSERFVSIFHSQAGDCFNQFILDSNLIIDVALGGYSFTWTDKYAEKMSKLVISNMYIICIQIIINVCIDEVKESIVVA